MPLSMKQKLQLMSFVSELSKPAATQELIDKATKRLGVSVNTTDLKEACRNAEVKWSNVCAQSGSPVSVLHNRVSELLNLHQTMLIDQRNMLDSIDVLERKLKGLE